ncbi:hypothetical protein [Streptomyces showdoensis]|uniref:Uncharacterized protein n=1 Tax=Streptomyces showdoensis TaxID=68268 RepID=A0A2P2GTJ0_STREW|nr:hypothetical protein [Streptomyces showdoensis]KKZ74817.1 hypothetical protein VO63_05010 [Streptomyces showdoensis]
MAIELSDELIRLQQEAVDARAAATAGSYSAEAWQPWIDAADALQAAITAYAAEKHLLRFDVEKELKFRVLHPEEYAERERKAAEKAAAGK